MTSRPVAWASWSLSHQISLMDVEFSAFNHQQRCPVCCVHLCGVQGQCWWIHTPSAGLPVEPADGVITRLMGKGASCHPNLLPLESACGGAPFTWLFAVCVCSPSCLCVACFSAVVFLVLSMICKNSLLFKNVSPVFIGLVDFFFTFWCFVYSEA